MGILHYCLQLLIVHTGFQQAAEYLIDLLGNGGRPVEEMIGGQVAMIGSRLLDNAADIRNRHGGMQRRYIQRAELYEMSRLRERLNLFESVAAAMASRMSQTYLMLSDL